MSRQDLSRLQWGLDIPWDDAFYDPEDDEVYTMRSFFSEGGVAVESISLSPLRTAHERFEDYPSLHGVIFDAQQRVGDGHARDRLPFGWRLLT